MIESPDYADAPPGIQHLLDSLVPDLLEGEGEMLACFREQYRIASIGNIAVTGAGLYADFTVPEAAPRVEPPDFAGGSAYLDIVGVEHGAGCVMHVRGGALATLEIFTYADHWPETCEVKGIWNVEPVSPL